MGSRSIGRDAEAEAGGNGMYHENHMAPAGPDVMRGEAGEAGWHTGGARVSLQEGWGEPPPVAEACPLSP